MPKEAIQARYEDPERLTLADIFKARSKKEKRKEPEENGESVVSDDTKLFSEAESEEILLERTFWLIAEDLRRDKLGKRKQYTAYLNGEDCTFKHNFLFSFPRCINTF